MAFVHRKELITAVETVYTIELKNTVSEECYQKLMTLAHERAVTLDEVLENCVESWVGCFEERYGPIVVNIPEE